MKTKLTLTVDDQVIRKAKTHLEKSSDSLSSVVERFLTELSEKGKRPSVVETTHGIAKRKIGRMTSKQIREEYHREKHGI